MSSVSLLLRALPLARSSSVYDARFLFADDAINWGTNFGCLQPLANNSVATSDSQQITATLTFTTGTMVGKVVQQKNADGSGGCATVSGGYGNFAPGTFQIITHANSSDAPGSGPLRVEFNRCVAGVGAQVSANYYGPLVAQLRAYDAFGALIATVLALGTSNGSADNSASFIGLRDRCGASIRSVVFSLASCGDPANCNDFLVNTIYLERVPACVSVKCVPLVALLPPSTSPTTRTTGNDV